MKHFAFAFVFLITIFITNTGYAQNDWVAYRGQYAQPTNTQTVTVNNFHINLPNIHIQQPTLTYDWVPYYSNQMIILEKRHLFCKQQQIIYRPFVQWIYQPVWKY